MPLSNGFPAFFIPNTNCIQFMAIFHPQNDCLTSMTRRADCNGNTSPIYTDLGKIKATCDFCQRESDLPLRFRVSLPSNGCVINKVVSVDLISLDGKTVYYMLSTETLRLERQAPLSTSQQLVCEKHSYLYGMHHISVFLTYWPSTKNCSSQVLYGLTWLEP